jgi:hypothetical protein
MLCTILFGANNGRKDGLLSGGVRVSEQSILSQVAPVNF